MTQCKHNNQALHSAGIKVTVEVWIEYESVAGLNFEDDEIEQLLLILEDHF